MCIKITSPPKKSFGKSASLSHSYATDSIGYNGTPKIHPKLPLPLQRSSTPSNTPIRRPDRPHTPPGSNQPFRHSTLTGPTDRQTDRSTDRHTQRSTDGLCDRSTLYTTSAYARCIDRERRALIITDRSLQSITRTCRNDFLAP